MPRAVMAEYEALWAIFGMVFFVVLAYFTTHLMWCVFLNSWTRNDNKLKCAPICWSLILMAAGQIYPPGATPSHVHCGCRVPALDH